MAAAVEQHHSIPHVEQDRKVDRRGPVGQGIQRQVQEQLLGGDAHTDLGRNLAVEDGHRPALQVWEVQWGHV